MRFGIFSVVDHYPAELSRTSGQFYGELLEQVEAAEGLGFDAFWIAEHHFHEYGGVPSPPVWMAAAAQRTKRIRLGAGVVVLPFRNPLQVAEDYAMVDVLSGGRLNLGTGSGTYVADSFEAATREAKEAMDRYVRTRLYARQRPYELLVDKQLIAFGGPEDVIRVARSYERAGLTDFLAITNFGGLAHARVLRSMELMARHVLPAFRG
jgi:alkanesulfonate monooxygenase SsuD/methylene tetrahydromethanopterin reductase-like flavin-dependent oxidoreductase (luciferase family)